MKISDDSIIQNLKDAGCDDATISDFMANLKSGKCVCGTKLLYKHRRSLLNNLHTDQKRIDCLDYLLYTIEKQNSAK